VTAIIEQNPDLVLDQSADDYWNHYQLTFALYSVSDRAIPSAFDGLKPGQRRLLYQMHESRLLPGNKPQKSSKVCSAVTGNLHPHGGASMYGAAALMAAEFQRVKVIDGQGAFPRIQGDIPAADRYTEMRLSAAGAALPPNSTITQCRWCRPSTVNGPNPRCCRRGGRCCSATARSASPKGGPPRYRHTIRAKSWLPAGHC